MGDRTPSGIPELPRFRYHPDPVGTGAVVAARVHCAACEQDRAFRYQGPVHAVADLADTLCPWCIADGTAAHRFDAEFTDGEWLVPDDISAAAAVEVLRRTPGFHAWQQGRWLHHCGDAAAFLGAVGAAELINLPAAVTALRDEAHAYHWPAQQTEEYLIALDKHGQPTAYLFQCLVCGVHLAYSDFT